MRYLEHRSVTGRVPDNPRELTNMLLVILHVISLFPGLIIEDSNGYHPSKLDRLLEKLDFIGFISR